MSLASLIGIDKERYNQGNKFLSQDPYLQNFQGRAPITFNQSAPNVDMMYGGNTNIYGAPTGGDGITTLNPSGFNQIENLFPTPSVPYENELSFQGKVPGMDAPAINFKDAPVKLSLAQDNPRVFEPLVDTKNAIQNFDMSKIRDYGIKGLASKMLSEGGAQAGFGIAGFPGALIGMLGGGALGLKARGPTDAERVVANFYGNQGNQPGFYIDPETGELVDSMMQGYNISSAYGSGIANALQARIDRINKTISNPNYRGQLKVRRDGKKSTLDKLLAEQKALEASQQQQARNMQDRNRATGTGGYQAEANYSDDFMEGPSDPGADLSSTMGSS
jgi:hypothetical protein